MIAFLKQIKAKKTKMMFGTKTNTLDIKESEPLNLKNQCILWHCECTFAKKVEVKVKLQLTQGMEKYRASVNNFY